MSLSSVALMALAAASPQSAQDARSFTRDGVSYTYTVQDVGQSTIISGRADGDRFRLRVRNGYVTGLVGSRPVSFRAEQAKKPVVQVVSR